MKMPINFDRGNDPRRLQHYKASVPNPIPNATENILDCGTQIKIKTEQNQKNMNVVKTSPATAKPPYPIPNATKKWWIPRGRYTWSHF